MSAEPKHQDDDVRLDRSQFSVAHLTDQDDALAYWLSRPIEERRYRPTSESS